MKPKNKKVEIITFHFVNNFGGALQAYALQETVKNVCHAETEIIDYRNSFIRLTDLIRLFPVTIKRGVVLSGLRTMRQRFGRIRKFRNFQRQNLNLSKSIYHKWKLEHDPPDADVYICGSDQIWNPFLTFGVDGAYYLDFVDGNRRRIAYAPSFGKSSMPRLFKRKIKKKLGTFEALSVREKNGISLIGELSGKKAVQLIDPAFLLDKKEWELLSIFPDIKENYILLYIMQTDDAMYAYAKKLKEKTGLSMVEISRYGNQPDFVDQTFVDVGPEEFLGLFQNASYICTNSYHGFIFSLIFEKRFCLIPCRRFRTRIYNLADLLSMEIKDFKPEDAADTVYDREKVEEIIKLEKQKAVDWLRYYILEE